MDHQLYYNMSNGYNIDKVNNFDNVDLIKFQCIYCKNIIKDGKKCVNCKKKFCEKCYKVSINYGLDKCCKLRNEITKEISNELNVLKFYCKNIDNGCIKENYYENINEHEINCEYNKLICVYDKCNAILKKDNFVNHLNNCEFKIISCEYCNINLEKINLKNHLNNCYFIPSECKYCLLKFKKFELSLHVDNCSKNLILCKKCNFKIQYKKYLKHTDEDCLINQFTLSFKLFNKKIKKIKNRIITINKKYSENYNKLNEICSKCRKFVCNNCSKICSECNIKNCYNCNFTCICYM